MRRKYLFALLLRRHETVLKFGIIGLCIFLIAWAFPKNIVFKYDYQKGKAWHYETLSAPFDFPLLKTSEEIEEERAAILVQVLPIFRYDEKLAQSLISDIRAEADNYFENTDIPLTDRLFFQSEAERIAELIISKGIFQPVSQIIRKGPNAKLRVLRNGKYYYQRSNEVYYLENALALIKAECKLTNPYQKNNFVNAFKRHLTSFVVYDKELTAEAQQDAIQNVSMATGLVHQGDMIISRGEIIDNYRLRILDSLKEEYAANKLSSRDAILVGIGQSILVILPFIVLVLFIYLFRRAVYNNNAKLGLILFLITTLILIYTWVLKTTDFSHYAVPLCITPIIIRAFFDTRLALFSHLCLVLIGGIIAPNGYEFMFIHLIAGILVLFGILNLRYRSQIFIASGTLLSSYFVIYACFSLLHEGNLADIHWYTMKWFVANAILALTAFPFIYLFEKLLGFVSEVTLIELSDVNHPLLKELSMKAPGTFQHSLQVANLAEAAIYAIGGNSLLVHTGALYHDIGKMENPQYFIENQSTSNNPHDDLSFEESAQIIIGHVIKGVEKAKKHNLPEELLDFIRTHHGNTLVQYFYQSHLKNSPEGIVDEARFRYPGPKPYSKETAVLMMADSVEAASRSLPEHDTASISRLVDEILEYQISQKQFTNATISFKDVETIRHIFKRMLMSIYHVRIDYKI